MAAVMERAGHGRDSSSEEEEGQIFDDEDDQSEKAPTNRLDHEMGH